MLCGLEIPSVYRNRLSVSLEAESDIGAGQRLKEPENRAKRVPKSRVLCGLEISNVYQEGNGGRKFFQLPH